MTESNVNACAAGGPGGTWTALLRTALAPGVALCLFFVASQAMANASHERGLAAKGLEIRATAPGMKATGGYLLILNNTDTDELLVSASAEVSERTELHNMFEQDGVLRMRAVENGIEVPAGGSVELRPGGLHLMFMGLDRQLLPGEQFEVTLEFASGRRIVAQAMVMRPQDITPGANTPADFADAGKHDPSRHSERFGGPFARFVGWVRGWFGG